MKFGRLPRAHDPRVPHLSPLIAGRKRSLAPIPLSCDYAQTLPIDLGMMGNDSVGDCTCAGAAHAIQVWTYFSHGQEITAADDQVLDWYKALSGFDPERPETDRGCVEQTVLQHWLTAGLPLGNGATDQLVGYFEVDCRNMADVRRAIAECGICYLGMLVPPWLEAGEPPEIWDRRLGDADALNQDGGHCVVACSYDATTIGIVSWGRRYRLTDAFCAEFLDEAYGLVSQDFIEATGKTPLGLTAAEVESQMAGLRAS